MHSETNNQFIVKYYQRSERLKSIILTKTQNNPRIIALEIISVWWEFNTFFGAKYSLMRNRVLKIKYWLPHFANICCQTLTTR